MKHNIQFQAWGRDAVVVCTTCGAPDTAGKLLVRAGAADGVSLVEAVEAIELHTGEGAFRATVGGHRVEEQIEFPPPYTEQRKAQGKPPLPGEEEPLVAYGPPDDYRAPGVSRMGQVMEPQPGHLRTDGGPSAREYLESKGEI